MVTVAAQLYTLRSVMRTPEEIDRGLERLAKDGWKAVQASGLGPIEPKELKAIADRHGLDICATHVSYESLVGDVDAVIRDHEILDCKYIGLGAMPGEFRSSGEGFREFARVMNPAAERIREAGRVFVYHMHNFEFARFGGKLGVEILMESLSDAAQIEPDTYWIQAGGADVVRWLERLSARPMDVVHFKDMTVDAGEFQPSMAEVGEGNLEWPAIIAACRKANVRWHIVEQDTCKRDPFDCLKTSLENLKKLGLE